LVCCIGLLKRGMGLFSIVANEAKWNSELIEQVFLPYDSTTILQIPVCTHNNDDFWSWNFEKSGRFTVRSAYRMIIQTNKRREDWLEERAGSSNNAAVEKSWNTLWKTKVPAKLRTFLWRLTKNLLPTEDVRKHRNMITHDSCSICGMQDSWRQSHRVYYGEMCLGARPSDAIRTLDSYRKTPCKELVVFNDGGVTA
jgi:hypothetical protein